MRPLSGRESHEYHLPHVLDFIALAALAARMGPWLKCNLSTRQLIGELVSRRLLSQRSAGPCAYECPLPG